MGLIAATALVTSFLVAALWPQKDVCLHTHRPPDEILHESERLPAAVERAATTPLLLRARSGSDPRRCLVHGPGFVANDSLFAVDELGDASIYDAREGRVVSSFVGCGAGTTFCEVSPTDGRALVGTPFSDELRDLSLVEVGQPTEMHVVGRTRRNEEGWRVATLAPDGRRALVNRICGHLELWDLRDGSLATEFVGDGRIIALAVSHGGTKAVSGTSGGVIQLWDLLGGELMTKDTTCEHETILALRFTGPWECVVAAADANRTHVFRLDLRESSVRDELETNFSASFACLDQEGVRAVSSSSTGALVLWDLAAKTVHPVPGMNRLVSASFSADGKHVVTVASASGPLIVRDFERGVIERAIPIP